MILSVVNSSLSAKIRNSRSFFTHKNSLFKNLIGIFPIWTNFIWHLHCLEAYIVWFYTYKMQVFVAYIGKGDYFFCFFTS